MKQALQRSLKSPDAILSMIIGLAVVLAVGYAIIATVRTANVKKQEEIKKIEEQKKAEEEKMKLPATYSVKDGDNLWVISEIYYKTGYNWVDISQANALPNPDYITVDQKLTIPDVKPRIVEEGDLTATAASTVRPKHTTYTVVAGDNLWDIAAKEYDSGYQWTQIATKNQIPNPDLIYPDTIIQLP